MLYNYGTITGSGNYIQTAGQTTNNGSPSQTSVNIQGGSLSGNGTITSNVTIGSRATVQLGNSPVTLTINGNFFSSGNMLFEIGELSRGQYNVLQINGKANFTGGYLEFDFSDDINASADDYWDFLFANNINGWNILS